MAGHHPFDKRRSQRPLPRRGRGRDDRDEALPGDEQEWFSQPWRDGRNAVRLLESLGILVGGSELPVGLQATLEKPDDGLSAGDYADISAIGLEASLLTGVDGVVVPAAAACLCNWIANSHGGGYVPNVHLRAVVGWLLWQGLSPAQARWEVGRARGRDLELTGASAAEFERLWFQRQYAKAWKVGLSG